MSPHDSTRWDLERALSPKGCPICRVTQTGIARFLDTLLYEGANDPDTRRHAAQALGFCNSHAWQMRSRHGSSLGIALLNRDALDQWQSQLERAQKTSAREKPERFRKPIAHANRAAEKCLACQRQGEIEQRCSETLLAALSDRAFAEALQQSAGLCRPHFIQACEMAPRSEAIQALVGIQVEINQRLIAELDEFIRKNDYRFMSKGFGSEGDVWIRSIEHLSGAADASR